jgi:hypothetical protein
LEPVFGCQSGVSIWSDLERVILVVGVDVVLAFAQKCAVS